MKRMVAVVAVLVTAVLMTGAGSAGAADAADQCVVHVLGERASGELILSERACYTTFLGAMRAEGVDAWGRGASRKVAGLAAATFVIGTHYDGGNFSGTSTSVVGSDCGGGWLNTSSAWNNRISSTLNGCPRIRHFNGANLTGANESTYGNGGTLGPLNNLTSSIQYTS